MPYVKIPDPNIIDISAWHQVVSVVNQHSDSIAALTNDFGINYEVVWGGDDSKDYSVQYDGSSQKILYGRALLLPTDDNNGEIWHEPVNFITPFSAIPVVTATVLSGNAAGSSTRHPDAVVGVYGTTTSGFNYRIFRPQADPKAIESSIWVNWIAIGPR